MVYDPTKNWNATTSSKKSTKKSNATTLSKKSSTPASDENKEKTNDSTHSQSPSIQSTPASDDNIENTTDSANFHSTHSKSDDSTTESIKQWRERIRIKRQLLQQKLAAINFKAGIEEITNTKKTKRKREDETNKKYIKRTISTRGSSGKTASEEGTFYCITNTLTLYLSLLTPDVSCLKMLQKKVCIHH